MFVFVRSTHVFERRTGYYTLARHTPTLCGRTDAGLYIVEAGECASPPLFVAARAALRPFPTRPSCFVAVLVSSFRTVWCRVVSGRVVYMPCQVGLSLWLLFALVAEAPSIAAQVLGAR